MQKFWNWNNEVNDEGVEERSLTIEGAIAQDSWFDDDVTPKAFREELFAGEGPVTVWINSPGGDTVAASRIYTMLMEYKGDVTVKIDGLAASAASVIAMAGTKVLMSPTALMMIHDPATCAFGSKKVMQEAIDVLTEVKESIINAYEIKTGLSRAKLDHMMESETWMNAKEAVSLGFADGMLEDKKKKSCCNAYSYSGRTANMAFVNKLTKKYAEPEEAPGVPADELMKRLESLK